MGVLAALVVYSLFIETRRFQITRVKMKARGNLPRPITILHLSDFHFGHTDHVRLRFLQSLHKTPVDIVVATGDLIDDDTGIELCVNALRGFKAAFGVFAVFGAHDHWDTRFWNVVRDLSLGGYRRGSPNDFPRLKRELEGAGIVCLQNEARRVSLSERENDDADLWMVGVDDLFAGLADFDKALDGVPSNSFKILLSHTVENPRDLAALGVNAVCAGHSHGGQVRFPLFGPVITRSSLARKYASGLFEVDGTPFHISRGIGTGKWTEFRFLCPPEATYIELTAS